MEYQRIFRCPICKRDMNVLKEGSILCNNRHTFDIARHGYVNFLTRPTSAKYEKELFVARRRIIVEENFFQPLDRKLEELISKMVPHHQNHHFILDAGCGEGSHLAIVMSSLKRRGNSDWQGIGIDITKEGVIQAAKNYGDLFWCVGDLAQSPFQDHTFSCIINILSPSNYKEFKRLLKPGGILIKAVPGQNYLKELREALFINEEKQKFTNEEVINHFRSQFHQAKQENLMYSVELKKEAMEDLLKMTPLTWGVEERHVQSFLEKGIQRVTVELDLLIGKQI